VINVTNIRYIDDVNVLEKDIVNFIVRYWDSIFDDIVNDIRFKQTEYRVNRFIFNSEDYRKSVMVNSRVDILAIQDKDINGEYYTVPRNVYDTEGKVCAYYDYIYGKPILIEVKYSKSSNGRDLVKELHKLVLLRKDHLDRGLELGIIVVADNVSIDEEVYMRDNNITYLKYTVNNRELDNRGDVSIWKEF